MPSVKDCHTLTSYYQTIYKQKYGRVPVVNRHKARWGFDSVLFDMSVAEAKSLLDFYLEATSKTNHSLEWFFNHYDNLIERRDEFEHDAAERRKLRAETKKRLEEWSRRQSGDN